jgi:hypothetical protein
VVGYLSQVFVVGGAIMAGLGYISFWWVAVPILLAASLQIVNGPRLDFVTDANRRREFGVFPMILIGTISPWLAVAGVVYGITSILL